MRGHEFARALFGIVVAACIAAEPGEAVGPDVVERELVGKNLACHPA